MHGSTSAELLSKQSWHNYRLYRGKGELMQSYCGLNLCQHVYTCTCTNRWNMSDNVTSLGHPSNVDHVHFGLPCMIRKETLPVTRKASSLANQYSNFLIYWLLHHTTRLPVHVYTQYVAFYVQWNLSYPKCTGRDILCRNRQSVGLQM